MHTNKTNNTNKLMQISYHSVLTKIQKLQNLKKKKTFFCTGRYCPKLAGTAGIFSGTKQRGRVYRIAGRYGIFRPYWPVRYGIDNLAHNELINIIWMRIWKKFFLLISGPPRLKILCSSLHAIVYISHALIINILWF